MGLDYSDPGSTIHYQHIALLIKKKNIIHRVESLKQSVSTVKVKISRGHSVQKLNTSKHFRKHPEATLDPRFTENTAHRISVLFRHLF